VGSLGRVAPVSAGSSCQGKPHHALAGRTMPACLPTSPLESAGLLAQHEATQMGKGHRANDGPLMFGYGLAPVRALCVLR
jgi:hypothetical protein